MVLSGTLREFILADVFQLLTQQKITGKLILTSGKSDGFVVFKNGQVIYAEKNTEKLPEKLQNYINKFSSRSALKLNELYASFEGNVGGLTLELLKRGFLTKEELTTLAETIIEDICCSLFLWKSGSYRFASMRTVDDLQVQSLTFPVENIVMEAMRRSDEWNRMQESLNKDLVFVRSSKDFSTDLLNTNPIEDSQNYVLSLVDGTSPVSEIVNEACLSEYKIYELLNNLLLNNSITPLSEQYTRSIQAALNQKKREKEANPISSLITIIAVTSTIILLFILANFVVKELIFSPSIRQTDEFKSKISNSISLQKASAAKLYFHAYSGNKATNAEELSGFRLVTNKDIDILKKGTILKSDQLKE